MSKRKNFGSLMLLSGLVLAVFLLFGSFIWMQDKANMLLAVFVLILYGMGQWLTVVYWQKIQEDWETTGEILGRLQQAVTEIPTALDTNLKSIATRLAENQQKALSELQAQVNEGARKTLADGAAQIGDSIAKNFKAPVDSLKVLLDTWEAKTREQADRIQAMAKEASELGAKASSQGSALIAESLDKNLRGPLAALQAALSESQEKARVEAEGARALWEELRKSQRDFAAKGESLAASVTVELKTLAAEGAIAAEESRKAWAEKAEQVQSAWDNRAGALEEKVLAALQAESGALGESFAKSAREVVSGLEKQVKSMVEAAATFEDGVTRVREASTALVREVQEKGDQGRAELAKELAIAQKESLAEAARLLEAQGQISMDVAGRVAELAAGMGQSGKDLQELAHISQVNQAEMQASVAMLNSGLSSILERLESQAKAGEGYQEFLADLGRTLAGFQERAAETLVENAMKTQEILMEVLAHAQPAMAGKAAAGAPAAHAEPEVASLS